MQLRDTSTRYGVISKGLHWSMALGIIALLMLGIWMVRLDYYHPYYTFAPYLHRSLGIIISGALLLRIGWRLISIKPEHLEVTSFERRAAKLVHRSLYAMLLCLALSGYLISTADGRTIDVFGWVEVPALFQRNGLSSLAGTIHRWTAYTLIALIALHALAASKHALTRYFAGTPSRNRQLES